MKVRRVIGGPPPQAPIGWEVYNAPRPLYGSQDSSGTYTWQGIFISGIFYAAIGPDDPEADTWRNENAKLDATRLEFVTRQSVIDEMVAYYRERYPDRFEQIFEEHPLDDPETQKMLIQTWYNLEMNWSEE